jgi:hypothetical protein
MRPDGLAEGASETEIGARATRLDRRLRELFPRNPSTAVRGAEIGHGGSLKITATGGLVLEITPSDSTEREQWRIFAPGDVDSHVVVLGTGLELPEAES